MNLKWIKRMLDVLVIIVLMIVLYFLFTRNQYNPTNSLDHSVKFAELNHKFIRAQVIFIVIVFIRYFVKKRYLRLIEEEGKLTTTSEE